jgi:hypothetical protein
MAIAVVTTNGAIGSATQATIVATQYWHKDHLGSTIAATDAAGAVIGRYSYDPFG